LTKTVRPDGRVAFIRKKEWVGKNVQGKFLFPSRA
jgi:hypothetical protein